MLLASSAQALLRNALQNALLGHLGGKGARVSIGLGAQLEQVGLQRGSSRVSSQFVLAQWEQCLGLELGC